MGNPDYYGVIAGQIIDGISSNPTIKTIEVAPNKQIEGKTANHKVDIYWEFEENGIKYTTIFDIKDLTNFDEERIIKFGNVLSDLPCQAKGVLLTPPGGSRIYGQFAEKNDVILYEAPEATTETDLGESIKEISFHVHLYQPHFGTPIFNCDKVWEANELKRLGISADEELKISFVVSDDMTFYDENGQKVTTALLLFNQLVPKGFEELPQINVVHRFEKPTFIKTKNTRFPRIKINSIEIPVSKTHEYRIVNINSQNFIYYAFNKVIESSVKTSDLEEMMKSNPNIVGYSKTLKDEIVDGKPSGRKAIRIYVAKKMPKSDLSRDQIIPDNLNGIPIDIIEIGELKLLLLSDSASIPTNSFRPLIGGISISRNSSPPEAGTLGYFVKDLDGLWYVLSCQHVLGNEPGMPIIQPGSLDKGRNPNDEVARLSRFINNDNIDAAIARIHSSATSAMNGLQSPIGIGNATEHMRIAKSGRTTKVTQGEVIDASFSCKLDGKIYHNQIAIKSKTSAPFADHGDSGSLIIDQQTNLAIGLIFAGNRLLAVANPITAILDAFDVTLVNPTDEYR